MLYCHVINLFLENAKKILRQQCNFANKSCGISIFICTVINRDKKALPIITGIAPVAIEGILLNIEYGQYIMNIIIYYKVHLQGRVIARGSLIL